MMSRRIFVTGIGTGIGKTVASAVLVQALGADYWKPVQAGDLPASDSSTVRKLVTHPEVTIFPERFRLTTPCSPHLAAQIDGVEIRREDFIPPVSERHLIIEGAGGVLVPLNRDYLIRDLITDIAEVAVVVVRPYLGSINHTLLTVEALQHSAIPLLGLLCIGERVPSTEEILLYRTGLPLLGAIPQANTLSSDWIKEVAQSLRPQFTEVLHLWEMHHGE